MSTEPTTMPQTYSTNPDREGRVLVLGMGGDGLSREGTDLNKNLRQALDTVPYLSDGAARIDYLALVIKDSADLTAMEIANIAKTIHRFQNSYDGFVIVAGTDTMPSVAASTAYALRGMGVPIIFIGATQNMQEWDTDFRLNLPNAVKVAVMGATDVNAPSFGEVGILFDDTLSRATAAINRGTRSNNPMTTPRVPKLGDVGWTVKLESIAKKRHPSQLNYSYNANTNIGYFDLVSDTHVSSFNQLVEDKTIQGIVIGAFGAGNVPTKLIPSIYKAVYEKGKVIAVITNNKKGSSDMGLYDVGAAAVKAGAISLGPMTKPAAIEKMRYALNNAKGEGKLDFLQDASRILLTSIANEIPEGFSRNAVNVTRERFSKTPVSLESFFKPNVTPPTHYDVKQYSRCKTSKKKILAISMGGTFYMEVNKEGSLGPSGRPLADLLDLKFQDLGRLVSLDYIELMNMDSTDIEHSHRIELAKTIARHAGEYDGIVVLHGTDTLAYTASALSYMLIGIDIDVVLTGAQRPGYGSSDFDRNFIRSVKTILKRFERPAKERVRPGVKVAFGDKLMIGTTVIKEDEHGINAFAPVEKHAQAGKLSYQIELYDIIGHLPKRPFTLFTAFDQNIAYFECINAIDITQFENMIENPDVHGILIGAYDRGNMPIQMKYYIATAVNSYNKPVAFISHTENGLVEMKPEMVVGGRVGGRVVDFMRAGGIALGDMIKESAFQKMCYAMGVANTQKGLQGREKLEFVRKILHTNIAGEISDRFCTAADAIYKGILSDRVFTDEEIQKAILTAKEEVKPLTKNESSKKTSPRKAADKK